MSSRSREFALILLVLLVAGALAAETAGLSSPVVSLRGLLTSPGQVTGTQGGEGLLILHVEYLPLTAAYALAAPAPSTDGLKVVLAKEGVGPLTASEYFTNSTGFLVQPLPPANYSVSIYHYIVNVSTQVRVLDTRTTELQIMVRGSSYEPQVVDLPIGQSLSVQPLTPVVVQAYLPTSVFGEQWFAFLDVYYHQNSTSLSFGPLGPSLGPSPLQVPVGVADSSVRGTGANASMDVWLQVQPEVALPLTGMLDVQLAIYTATTSVMTYGD